MIDPSAFIAAGAVVLGDVHLGKDASVWYNAVIRGDTERIEIGDESNIQDLAMVHADPGFPCIVGRRVTVGHRAILHGCVVEDECLIGMGAILLNGVRRRPGLGRRGRGGPGRRDGGPARLAGARRAGQGRPRRWTRRCGVGSTTPGGITSTEARRHRGGEFPIASPTRPG